MTLRWRDALLLFFGCALFPTQTVYCQSEPEAPKAAGIMRAIFSQVAILLPASLKKEDFAPEGKVGNKVSRSIDLLATYVDQFEKMSQSYGDDFHFIAENLREDLHRVRRYYHNGQYQQSAFVLQNMTENCFACHAKYPEKGQAPQLGDFLTEVGFDQLEIKDRAKLLVIVRQFEKACSEYESLMLANKSLEVLFQSAFLEEYLNLTINIMRDFKRPSAFLSQLLKKATSDDEAKGMLKSYIGDLELFKAGKLTLTADLKNAIFLINEAKKRTEHFYDESGMIYWTAAVAVMHQMTLTELKPEVGAEVYYQLGAAATLFEHSFWVSQAPSYLEKSIELAPTQSIAEKAYRLLKQNLIVGYAGSSGLNLPKEEQDRLARLWQKVLSKGGSEPSHSQLSPNHNFESKAKF